MTKIKFIFSKLLIPLFMVLLTTVLTINAIYFMSVGSDDQELNTAGSSYTDMVKKGNISSLITLGEMYEKGHFVKKDLEKSQAFFKKAINYINNEMDDTVDNSNDIDEKEISERELLHDDINYSDLIIPIKSESKKISTTKKSEIKQAKYSPKKKTVKTIIVAQEVENDTQTKDHISYDDLETIDITDNDFPTEEIDPVIIDDDNLFYEKLEAVVIDENIENEVVKVDMRKIITIQTASEEILSKNSFSSNPCNTAAARYIAKCIKIMRANRKH